MAHLSHSGRDSVQGASHPAPATRRTYVSSTSSAPAGTVMTALLTSTQALRLATLVHHTKCIHQALEHSARTLRSQSTVQLTGDYGASAACDATPSLQQPATLCFCLYAGVTGRGQGGIPGAAPWQTEIGGQGCVVPACP